MAIINKITDLFIKIKDGLGNPITSTDINGKKALDINIVGGTSTLQIGDLVGDSPITVVNGTGGVFNDLITIKISDAKADGITKGAATFNANDFNDNGNGVISIDYINGQKASATTNGFLSASDWNIFNNKADVPERGNLIGISPINVTNGLNAVFGSGTSISINDATTTTKGIVQLSNNYSGTSQTVAVTEKALSDGLATKENVLTKGNIVAGSNKLLITGSLTNAVIGSGVTFDVQENNILHQQLNGAGTYTHADIDAHIININNPHNVTKDQIGLGNVTNDAQVKKIVSSTVGNIPTWASTTGDILDNGYGVETILVGSSSNLARADAIKNYIDSLITSTGILTYKGTINCSTNPNYPAADSGHVYIVSVAGKIGGNNGINVEIGDMLICKVNNSPNGDQATAGNNWNIIQSNMDGIVTGPSSATINSIPVFISTSGKIIGDSGYIAQDASISAKGFVQLSNNYSGTSQSLATTEKALSDGLATKENILTKGNISAGSNKVLITGSPTNAVIGTGVSIDVQESNISINNLSGILSITKGGTGQTTANDALNALLPSQTGNAGKYLQTDGTNSSWQPLPVINNKCRVRQTIIQNIPNAVNTRIIFNTIDYNILNEFNITQSRFTATTAGYYLITSTVNWASVAGATGIFRIMIYKNGVQQNSSGILKVASKIFGICISDILYLAAGDYIEIYVFQDSGVARTTEISAGNQSYLAIHRLS